MSDKESRYLSLGFFTGMMLEEQQCELIVINAKTVLHNSSLGVIYPLQGQGNVIVMLIINSKLPTNLHQQTWPTSVNAPTQSYHLNVLSSLLMPHPSPQPNWEPYTLIYIYIYTHTHIK